MRSQSQPPGNGRQQPVNQFWANLDISKFQIQKSEFRIPNSEFRNEKELAEIWARRAHALAEEPPSEATGQTADLLVFWLGDEQYGIEVANVREIYSLPQLTPIPRTPDFVAGVFSARGRILSVIDLRAFFGLLTPSANGNGTGGLDQAKIIVVANTNLTSEADQPGPTAELMEVGILAGDVTDMITIFKEEIEPPLTTYSGVQAEFIQGITADMLVVLNLNALLSSQRLIVREEIL